MANMLNCELGQLPTKYLGILVSDAHLRIRAFDCLNDKMMKRLDPWKGKFLLTNSCLSSLPMYIMGAFLQRLELTITLH